jgi:O-antigen/teichoic acid export membrane protein
VTNSKTGVLAILYRRLGILTTFTVGQGALQALQIISGMVLVWEMAISEYGVLAFATAVQGVVSILSDMGCRDAVVALAGRQSQDKANLGKLIKAVFRLRIVLWACASAIGIALLVGFHVQHAFPLPLALLLSVLISATSYLNGWSLYYSIPALMHHRMRELYWPQVAAAAARLVALLALAAAGFLDAVSATAVAGLAAFATGLQYRRAFQSAIVFPDQSSSDALRQIRSYVLSIAPATFFNAFQDQVLVFVLAILGQTRNVAEVFALGRLGQAFQFLSSGNVALIMPWVAKADRSNLKRRYALVVSGAVTASALIMLGVLWFPSEVLFLLGKNYRSLGVELQLSMGAACLAYLAAVIWSLNSARRWIWPWSGSFYVAAVLSVQVWCVLKLDLSTTRGAIQMALAAASAAVVVQVLHGFLGFGLRPNQSIE